MRCVECPYYATNKESNLCVLTGSECFKSVIACPLDIKCESLERCKGCKYLKSVNAGNCNFYGCSHYPYKGKWISEIEICPIVSD